MNTFNIGDRVTYDLTHETWLKYGNNHKRASRMGTVTSFSNDKKSVFVEWDDNGRDMPSDKICHYPLEEMKHLDSVEIQVN